MQRVEPDEVHLLAGAARVVLPVEGDFRLDPRLTTADAFLEVIARHPMTHGELVDALSHGRAGIDVERALLELAEDERIQVVERWSQKHWAAAGDRYAPEAL